MTSTDTIKVEILAVTDAAIKGVESFREKISNLTTVLGPYYQAAKKIVSFGVEMLKEYAEAEAATVKLETALKNKGIFSDASLQKLENIANQLQVTTTYADEVTVGAMATIASLTNLNADQIAELITRAQNFATARNIDLETASTMIAKTIAGTADALGRYGIEISKSLDPSDRFNEIIKAMDTNFRGFSEAIGETTTGKMAIINNQLSELREILGGMVADSDILQNLITFFYDLSHIKDMDFWGGKSASQVKKAKEELEALAEAARKSLEAATAAAASNTPGLTGLATGGKPPKTGGRIDPGIAPPSMSAMMPTEDAFFAAIQGLETYSAALDLAMAAEGRMAQKTTYLDTALANLGEQMASAALREGISALNKLGEAFGAGTLGESVSAADIIWDMVEALLNNMATLALGAAINAAIAQQWVAFWILIGIAGVSAIAAGVMTGVQTSASNGTNANDQTLGAPEDMGGTLGMANRRGSGPVINVYGSVWNGDDLAVAYGKALMRA